MMNRGAETNEMLEPEPKGCRAWMQLLLVLWMLIKKQRREKRVQLMERSREKQSCCPGERETEQFLCDL